MRNLLLACSLVLLAGCVAAPTYEPVTATNRFQDDQFDCEQLYNQTADAHAYKADPIGNMYAGFGQPSFMHRCLERKGWKRTP